MKNILITLVIVIALALGVYYYFQDSFTQSATNQPAAAGAADTQGATSTDTTEQQDKTKTLLGTSAHNHDILAYHYGEGDTELLFVGGIHGGYEWNTVLVAYELMDYLVANPEVIPANVRVTVIPVLNPDGLDTVVGTTGRFNAADVSASQSTQIAGRVNGNGVDLNRNFDCDWQAKGTWQSKSVSGGSAAFSEPEAQAVQAYIANNTPAAVVVWYSAAGGVYSSSCHNGILPETAALTKAYAKAAGYASHETFDSYEITGDLTNWLAKLKIPAISVLLTTHQSVEWEKNRAGIEAMLQYYAQQ